MKHCRGIWACVFFVIVWTFSSTVSAEVPERGLRAEMAGQWEEALELYRQLLEQDPERLELWIRTSDIQSHLQHPEEAAFALKEAVLLDPENPELHFRLSRAYATAGQPQEALKACQSAYDLDSGNREFLETCALQAVWAGETKRAKLFYDRLLELNPGDPEALLGRARIRSWNGELDRAVNDYRTYLEKKDEDREAWIELTDAQIWRGNLPGARDTLKNYRQHFGKDRAYHQTMATLLARGGRPRQALEIIDSLPPAYDTDLEYTRTIALNADRRKREALAILQDLERRHPEKPEIAGLSKFVRTPLRSLIALRGSWYRDSDDIRIFGTDLEGTWVLSPETRLYIGGLWEVLSADAGSGLERNDGGENIENSRGWIGFGRRVGASVAVEGKAGGGTIEDGGDFFLYEAVLKLDPHDDLSIELRREQDLYAISPRAVSEEVIQRSNRIHLEWRPDLRCVIVAEGAYDDFSDDNSRWEVIFAPRRAMLRTESLNLDLGVSTWWFGFDRDLNHGYYDPGTYQRHALTAFGYWKIAENHGIGMNAALGVQKDENMSGFRFGEDVAAEGYFGIYRDWMLQVSLGYADRDQEGGGFDGFSARASLTRRF